MANPNIILAARRPRIDRAQNELAGTQLQNTRMQQQANAMNLYSQGQALQRDAAKRNALAGLDPSAPDYHMQAAKALQPIDSEAAAAMHDKNFARQGALLGRKTNELDYRVKQGQALGGLFMGVETQEQWDMVREQARNIDPDINLPEAMPAPEQLNQMSMAALNIADRMKQQNADRKYQMDSERFSETQRHNRVTEQKPAMQVINAGPSKAAELQAVRYDEMYRGLQDAYRSSEKKAMDFNLVNRLLENVYTGAAADVKQSAKKLARVVGIDLGDVSGPEAAAMISNELALQMRSPQGGAGMPGAMSDKDREFLVSMTPQITTTAEGRKLMAAIQNRIAKRNREIAKDARDYVRKPGKNGMLDVDFEEFIAQKYGGRHIFEDLHDSLPGGESEQAGFQEGQVYRDPVNGTKARYEGGNWVEIEQMAFDPKNAVPLNAPKRFDPANAVPDEGFSAITALQNAPQSAFNYGRNMYEAVRHPLETAKSLVNVSAGFMDKAIPGQQPSEPYADAVIEFVKERYGSLDKLKQTMMNDPIGVLADASMVLTLGGSAAGRVPGVVGQAGKAIARAGSTMEPVNVLAGTVKVGGTIAAKATPKSVPRELYGRAAKWSTVADKKKGVGARARMTDTALREGITLDDAGVGRVLTRIRDLGDDLDTVIDAAGNQPVDVSAVRLSLSKTRKDLGGFKLSAKDNLPVVDMIEQKFDALVQSRGGNITARDLLEFRRDLDADINWDLSSANKGSRAANSALKDMRTAAKETLETVDPRVAEINAQLSDLMDIKPDIIQAAGRNRNKNPIGISEPIMIGAGAAMGGASGAGQTAGAVAGGTVGAIQRRSAEIAVLIEKYRRQGVPEAFIAKNILPGLLRNAANELGKLQQVDQPTDGEVSNQPKNARDKK